MKLILKSSELFSEFRAYSRVQSAEFRVQIFSKISRSRRIPAFFGWAGRIAQGKGKKEKVKVIVTLRVGIKNVELFPTFYYLNAVFDPSPLFSQRKHAHRNGAGRLIWNVYLSA